MTNSVQEIDAASQRNGPAQNYPSPQKEAGTSSTKQLLVSQIQLPPSPADSQVVMREASPRGSPTRDATAIEEKRITRNIERGTPGDDAIFSESKTPEQRNLAKRKSQFYGDVFANREPNGSARERVLRESPILADVRTNVIVEDEYTFITNLSYTLSARYQRPENTIVVILKHTSCLLFGGTFEPAYCLTINALPSQLQPVTNKRNAALLAKAMEEELGVAPDRGLIKFCPIPEENFALNGKTVAGDIEDLEKENAESSVNLTRSLSRGTPKSKRRQSMKSLRSLRTRSQLPTHEEDIATPPPSDRDTTPPLPALPTDLGSLDPKALKQRKMSRRRSFIATIFGRAG